MFKKLFTKEKQSVPKEVGDFYNRTTADFMASHGDVIQSLRTFNITDYLDYTIKSAKFEDNQINLDAGCGVGGPSIYFAQQVNSVFHGITISTVQADIANKKVAEKGLQDRVHIKAGDYHDIAKMFGKEYFDRVFFLESFGHSNQKIKLLEAAWDVLKPGGILYIKDLFERESIDPFEKKRIREGIHTINSSYKFNIEDLHPILSRIRTLNFVLDFIKVPEVEHAQLDAFKVSTEFQDTTKIGLDPSHEDWVFPVDYYEIRCRKPHFDHTKNREIYYLNR